MIDTGLLATMVIVIMVPAVFVHPWPQSAVPAGLIDTSLGALMIGLVAGRLTSVLIDDPSSIGRINDVMIVRSGVEFWAGAGAGTAWIVWRARREGVAPRRRLAALTAPALVAWACYEATCLLRDGCAGPVSPFGLHPPGLVERMFPVGLAMAAGAGLAAWGTRRLHRRGMPDGQVVVLAVLSVAAIRAAASFWLPRVGDGLTRQHRESLLIAVACIIWFGATAMRHRSRWVEDAT
jgi:hypothetical protein